MNIIPVTEPDTLPIVFDRGLIGMYHDWCEPHSTYPRSYDLMHSDHLLSSLTKKYAPLFVCFFLSTSYIVVIVVLMSKIQAVVPDILLLFWHTVHCRIQMGICILGSLYSKKQVPFYTFFLLYSSLQL